MHYYINLFIVAEFNIKVFQYQNHFVTNNLFKVLKNVTCTLKQRLSIVTKGNLRL